MVAIYDELYKAYKRFGQFIEGETTHA